MIALRTIEEVRQIPINEVIARFNVQLKQKGASYTACCPFHDEKTPSFVVTPSKGIYKCFGCGASGDGIKFTMEKRGLDFYSAIEEMAKAHDIEVEREKLTEEVQQRIDSQKDLLKILSKTAVRYAVDLQKNLATDSKLYNYLLHDRGLLPDTVTEWELGYAADWRTITNVVKERGKIVDATKAGIVKSGEKNYDIFHHRLVIPIRNYKGEVISFGGRALPWGEFQEPKYINGSDTPVYLKGEHLFGLHKALPTLHKTKHAYLVEGYFDVIRCHQYGATNTVGSLGTALTEKQAKLLKRYASHVTVIRDGDNAGRKAAVKDIDILAAEGFGISMLILPEGDDPDTYLNGYSCGKEVPVPDAIEWRLQQMFAEAKSPVDKIAAIRECVVWMLDKSTEELERDLYIEAICKQQNLKKKVFTDEFKRQEKEEKQERERQEAERSTLPNWVTAEKREHLFEHGFVQLAEFEKPNYQPGIYFGYSRADFNRLTNYTVKPLYFIMDPGNERRLIEINNGKRDAVIELSKRSMIEQGAFETDIATRPGFFSMPGFGKIQYKTLANWINSSTRTVYELTSLGWQNEGFFAFSNKALHDGKLLDYDDYGIVTVNDRSFLSPGVSKLQKDLRDEDNIYENDLYLKYIKSPITLEEHFKLFYQVYGEDGALGIAFIGITAFLDIVGSVTKRPIFYSFGPKDSGKSALNESIMWFFFSGKNSEGKLIQGYNLNPGQGTHFSFFSRVMRFQNCAMLFNEYDPNTVEPWKKGAFKSYYDGEGREVGSGDTGKKRKTTVQKWRCSAMIVGQYLDTGDEGSVISRSIICRFSLEKNKNRTDEEKALWKKLNDIEHNGISSLVDELYKIRPQVKADLKKYFWEIQPELNRYFKNEEGMVVEARLLNNYTLCLAMVKIMTEQLSLPFNYPQFETIVKKRLKMHQLLLSDNSILTGFWRDVEVLFDNMQVRPMYNLKVERGGSIVLKQSEGLVEKMENLGYTSTPGTDRDTIIFHSRIERRFLYIRFDGIYDKYAEAYNRKNKKGAPNPDTLLAYLKDQSYWLGLCKGVYFKDKVTSAYVLDYDKLGINLEKRISEPDTPGGTTSASDLEEAPPFS